MLKYFKMSDELWAQLERETRNYYDEMRESYEFRTII